MSSIELHYFNVRGLGHSLRLILAYKGVEFKDIRVTKEEWTENGAALKAKFPFGQMPVLVIDGKQYAQSTAIARYLGRKYGLAGADIEEDFEIDQNIAFIDDIRMRTSALRYEENEEIQKKKHEDLIKNYYPVVLITLHDILKKNNGHLAAGKLTWGDFVLAGIYRHVKQMAKTPDFDQKYPLFKQLTEKVESFPKVKAFLDKSPKFDD